MNKTTKTLALLIVEDVESDALLIVRLLKKAGYELVYEQVETAVQMRTALEKQAWDIIISDYRLPQFNGEEALAVLKQTGQDVPFIAVSGTMGEATAVAMMKAGAQDYLMKDNLARLVPAVQRELEQAEVRRERRQAQEQLLLQSSALNAAANAIVITNREGTVEWANPSFTTLTQYTLEEAIGENLYDLLKSDRQDRSYYQKLWNTIVAGEVWHGEMINRRKDGSLYIEEMTITPLKNADGMIDHFIAIKQDVSARKQAEASLAASESELRALVEQVPAIVYTESAETRETMYISPRVEKVTGYTPGEWIEDQELWMKMIHPEDREAVVNEDMRTTTTREPFQAEYRILTRDGCTIWIQDEAVLIENPDGTPLFWQGVMYDITERKQVEEDMQTTNILLEQTLEQSPIPMVLVSMPDGIIRSANSASRRFLGIDDEPSPVGTSLFELRPSWQDFDMQGNPGTLEELPLARSLRGLKTAPRNGELFAKTERPSMN
jgi:PAS domain S-box-containing protein